MVSFWTAVFWKGALCQIFKNYYLHRKLCSVHLKSSQLNWKICVKRKMCLEFWRLEKRFSTPCVSLNSCTVRVIWVRLQLGKINCDGCEMLDSPDHQAGREMVHDRHRTHHLMQDFFVSCHQQNPHFRTVKCLHMTCGKYQNDVSVTFHPALRNATGQMTQGGALCQKRQKKTSLLGCEGHHLLLTDDHVIRWVYRSPGWWLQSDIITS